MNTPLPPPPRPEEISVVMQGPIYGEKDGHLTKRALATVRRALPKAEIILSTWPKSAIEGLDFDRLVESPDPGGVPQPHDTRYLNNTNRQIVSTAEGLKAATRKYAIKLRSDHLLEGRSFLDYFERFPERGSEYAIFAHRVIIPNVYSLNPDRCSHLFHPSDWFFFGLREDLLLMWDIPFTSEPEATQYFQLHPEENVGGFREMGQHPPEQYDWLQCLRKRYTIPHRHMQDISLEAVRISDLAMVNNFIVLELPQIPLVAPRHRYLQGTLSDCYSHGDFLRLYRKHCDPSFPVPLDWSNLRRFAIRGMLGLREKLLGSYSGLRPPARVVAERNARHQHHA